MPNIDPGTLAATALNVSRQPRHKKEHSRGLRKRILSEWGCLVLSLNRNLRPKDPHVRDERRRGFGLLPSGQPYIHGWPAGRKGILCDESNQQTIPEAAGWAAVCFDVARDHAQKLDGNPLLLSSRCLQCSSSFTGLLVLLFPPPGLMTWQFLPNMDLFCLSWQKFRKKLFQPLGLEDVKW